jgi:hypothetical protein
MCVIMLLDLTLHPNICSEVGSTSCVKVGGRDYSVGHPARASLKLQNLSYPDPLHGNDLGQGSLACLFLTQSADPSDVRKGTCDPQTKRLSSGHVEELHSSAVNLVRNLCTSLRCFALDGDSSQYCRLTERSWAVGFMNIFHQAQTGE